LVQQGVFRGDLFYRLNVVPIRVPALRDRGADVIALARRFVARFAEQMGRRVQGLTPDVARQLMSFPWPGNVRQLENVIERAVALARFELIRLEDLPDDVRSCSVRVPTTETPSSELPTLEEFETRYIHQVLQIAHGNKTQAAEILGIDRRTLYRRLERLRPPRMPNLSLEELGGNLAPPNSLGDF
jgi:transcriptional regulator with PAS, ATPase and Fis domain